MTTVNGGSGYPLCANGQMIGYASGLSFSYNTAPQLPPLQYATSPFTTTSMTAQQQMLSDFGAQAAAAGFSAEPAKPKVQVPDFVGPRPFYKQADLNRNWKELEGEDKTARPAEAEAEDANLIGSKVTWLEEDGHLPVIDLDLPCHLEPSITEGHFHLYVNKVVAWDKYVALLKAMYEAGLVEEGFYEMTVARGESYVRPSWVAKKPGEGSSK